MAELVIDADVNNLEPVQEFVRQQIGCDCPNMSALMQIDLAVEEIFVNIAHYAYSDGVGKATIRCDYDDNPPCLTMVFCDSGRQFDPLAKPDPNVEAKLEERGIGGLGIYLTKKYMNHIEYEYKDGQNILTLVKNL